MKINKAALDKLAHLSRLSFKEEEQAKMIKDLNNILSFVEKLSEVDTENIKPLQSMTQEINQMRDDKVSNQINRSDALKNAPQKDEVYFKVPKVIE